MRESPLLNNFSEGWQKQRENFAYNEVLEATKNGKPKNLVHYMCSIIHDTCNDPDDVAFTASRLSYWLNAVQRIAS